MKFVIHIVDGSLCFLTFLLKQFHRRGNTNQYKTYLQVRHCKKKATDTQNTKLHMCQIQFLLHTQNRVLLQGKTG
jgi:hypothetical protein